MLKLICFPFFSEISIALIYKIPFESILNSTDIFVSPFGLGLRPSILVSFNK